jgi:nitrous oxidase accessory protein NosD
MTRSKAGTWLTAFIGSLIVCAGNTCAMDIGGTISTTLTITDNSQLVDDVTCTVTGAPCIVVGAPNVTLELNGFTMTGQADQQTACSGGGNGAEPGIAVNTQMGVEIHGPGLVKQFRGFGITLVNSIGAAIIGVTTSTNCFSGIFLSGGSDHRIERNVSVRNGNGTSPCGGI